MKAKSFVLMFAGIIMLCALLPDVTAQTAEPTRIANVKVYTPEVVPYTNIVCTYLEDGNLSEINCTNAVGEVTYRLTYQYTAQNQIEQITIECLPCATIQTHIFSYFENGLINNRHIYDENGLVCEKRIYTYDANRKLQSIDSYDGDNLLVSSITFVYGEEGRLNSEIKLTPASADLINLQYTYTTNGRRNDVVRTSQTEAPLKILFVYNEGGRLDKLEFWQATNFLFFAEIVYEAGSSNADFWNIYDSFKLEF